MKGTLSTDRTPSAIAVRLRRTSYENALRLSVRLSVIFTMSICFRELSAPQRDPMLLILGIYAACQIAATVAWRHSDDAQKPWLLSTIVDFVLIFVIAAQIRALPSCSPLALLLLAGLSMTGPAWRSSLLAGISISGLVVLIAMAGPQNQDHPAWILSFLGWFPLLLIFASQTREYQRVHTLIPAPDEVPGLNNKVTLDYAARFFIPYQQRNLAPISLVAIRLIARERVEKSAGRALSRLNEKRLAAICEARIRKCDVAVRISADTYALLLPDCNPDGAMTAVREIQSNFADWVTDNRLRSFTVACIIPLPTAPTAMNHLADILEKALEQVLQSPSSAENTCFFAPDSSALR